MRIVLRLALLGAMVLGIAAVGAMPSMAQEESSIEIEGDVTLLTDYDFRGISRTAGHIAIQGGLAAYSDNGFYGGVLASSLNDDYFGYEVETEVYLGYGTPLGAYDLDVSLSLDSLHQSGNSRSYGELRGSLSRDYGFAYLKLGAAYTPDNREYGLGQSFYGFGTVEVPLPLPQLPPMSLELHAGYEAFEGVRDKIDWKVGLYVDLSIVEAGVRYYGSNRDEYSPSGDSVLFSLRKYF